MTQRACAHGRFGVAFAFAEGMSWDVRVQKSGYASVRFRLPEDAADSGGVFQVELERMLDAASLTLSISAEIELTGLPLRVRYDEWLAEEPRPDSGGKQEGVRESRRGSVDAEGRFELGMMTAGRWLVRVEADSWRLGLAPSFLIPAELVVDLAPGEAALRELTLRAGGLLRVVAPLAAADGRLEASVRTAADEHVELRFNRQDASWYLTELGPGLNVGTRALDTGDYVLDLRRGQESLASLPFRIERNEATELRIELDD